MQAGRLTRRLTLLRHDTEGEDEYGGALETWSPADPPEIVFARRTDVSDGEMAKAGADEGTLRARFVVRRSSKTTTVTGKDRFSCRDLLSETVRVFAIIGIKDVDGDAGAIEWTAEARNAA